MNLVFHPEATEEFEDATRYYQLHSPALGERFATEIQRALVKIQTRPKLWRLLEEDLRRCRVKVFPYSVLYTIESRHILILAIMHDKRQPGYWRSRKRRD